MNRTCLCLLLAVLVAACAAPAFATTVWRSPFGIPYAVAVNQTDGTVWAATGGSVMHLAPDGAILSQTNGFYFPRSLAVNPTDGSCWVTDDYTTFPIGERELEYGAVVHLAADGTVLLRSTNLSYPKSVAVCPADGSCWVLYNGGACQLAADGARLRDHHGGGFQSVAVDPSSGVVWIADTYEGELLQILPDGTEQRFGGDLIWPSSLAVDPADGSCWVADCGSDSYYTSEAASVSHYSAAGALLWRGGAFECATSLAIDPSDGSVWVQDLLQGPPFLRSLLVHLAPDGTELWRGAEYGGGWEYAYGTLPDRAVSVSPLGGPIWFANYYAVTLIRLERDGSERHLGASVAVPNTVDLG